jgi:hypothetical protein
MFEYVDNGKVLYYHTFRPEIFFVTDENGVVVSPIEVNLGRERPYDILDMTCDSRGEPTPLHVMDRATESLQTYLNIRWDGKDIEYK